MSELHPGDHRETRGSRSASEDADYSRDKRVEELESALAERDKRIVELEAENREYDDQVQVAATELLSERARIARLEEVLRELLDTLRERPNMSRLQAAIDAARQVLADKGEG